MRNRFKDTVAFCVLILYRLFTGILICGHGRLRGGDTRDGELAWVSGIARLCNGIDSQFSHGLAHSQDILRWDIGLHVVYHSGDKATTGAKLSDAKFDLFPNFFRRSVRQHLLGVYAAPERQSVSILALNTSGIIERRNLQGMLSPISA